ncbi:MAG TPA: hypothetical protein VLC54_03370 [Anaeromyxobacter sp.]|nr:hypothetical protein [Anaeromyxobacter sp.]
MRARVGGTAAAILRGEARQAVQSAGQKAERRARTRSGALKGFRQKR